MLDILRQHFREWAVGFGIMLALLQFLMPSTLDLLFGAAMVGLIWLNGKYGSST